MELKKGGTWLCATLVYTQLLVQFWDKSLSSAEFFTSITNMEQLDFEKFDESPRIKGLLWTGNSFATRAYFLGTLWRRKGDNRRGICSACRKAFNSACHTTKVSGEKWKVYIWIRGKKAHAPTISGMSSKFLILPSFHPARIFIYCAHVNAEASNDKDPVYCYFPLSFFLIVWALGCFGVNGGEFQRRINQNFTLRNVTSAWFISGQVWRWFLPNVWQCPFSRFGARRRFLRKPIWGQFGTIWRGGGSSNFRCFWSLVWKLTLKRLFSPFVLNRKEQNKIGHWVCPRPGQSFPN